MYGFVLFLHVFFVLMSFGLAAVMHVTMIEMRGVVTVAELRSAARRLSRLEPLFPISALLFFLAGAYLVSQRWSWSAGWIVTAIAGLVVMEALGGTLLKKATATLHKTVDNTPDGPLTPNLRSMIRQPSTWIGAHVATGLGLGIVYLMTNKPSGVASASILLGFAVVAVLSALPFCRSETTSTNAVTTTAATANAE